MIRLRVKEVAKRKGVSQRKLFFRSEVPRDAQRGKPIGRARKRLAKEREMCLLKRKEPSEYFLRRRLYDQYDMFTSPDSNLAAIGSLNAVLVWGSGPHGALPEPARSA